jgi:TRAP-type C4-dicarboxylate transport system substrate-binding protein
MSEKKADKGKFFKKLHQLQKRLFRSLMNEGHSEEKIKIREAQEKKLIEKIKGKNKK